MTQRARVLAMLRAAGTRGVTTGEFLDARIPRFSARLQELRDAGYGIDGVKERDGSWRYTLTFDPVRDATQAPAVVARAAEDVRLLDVSEGPRSALLGWDEDAA